MPSNAFGINMRVSGHSNQGMRKYMEDNFLVEHQKADTCGRSNFAFFGVFDGHGGSEASVFAKENLLKNICNHANFWSNNDADVLSAIHDGFIDTHLQMLKVQHEWPKTRTGLPSTSGTTASIALIRRSRLYIGHVGDSRIVLGKSQENHTGWIAKALTTDHKPDDPGEQERIYRCGGAVAVKAGVSRVVWHRPKGDHIGPLRRSTQLDQIPFLAVSRSLGDLWSYNYENEAWVVSPEPQVGVYTLDPEEDKCLIIGSDGVWNMMSSQESVNRVYKVQQLNEQIILRNPEKHESIDPSRMIVETAIERWKSCSLRADNTSVVCVLFDPPGPTFVQQLVSRHAKMMSVAASDNKAKRSVLKAALLDSSRDETDTSDEPKMKKMRLCEESVHSATEEERTENKTEERSDTVVAVVSPPNEVPSLSLLASDCVPQSIVPSSNQECENQQENAECCRRRTSSEITISPPVAPSRSPLGKLQRSSMTSVDEVKSAVIRASSAHKQRRRTISSGRSLRRWRHSTHFSSIKRRRCASMDHTQSVHLRQSTVLRRRCASFSHTLIAATNSAGQIEGNTTL